jgi:hypothetical protein
MDFVRDQFLQRLCFDQLVNDRIFKGGSDSIPIMSNRLFLANGTQYPFQALITPDAQFNETAYEEYGPVYMSS